MHRSTYDKCGIFVNKYLDPNKELNILDVGSLNENGSYDNLFFNQKWLYEGCDIIPGANVNFVMLDKFTIPRKDESYDVVISGQTMEHVDFFWVWIRELTRVLKKDGLLFLTAPGNGPVHRSPIDCWRFHPDGMIALAEWSDLEVLESYMTTENEWWDCVLIAKKK